MFDVLVARSQSFIKSAELHVLLPEQAFVRAALSRLSGSSRRANAGGSLTYLAGPVGIGKSFLAHHAIRDARRRHPKLRFLVATAEELADLLTAADEQQDLADLLEQFDQLDLLICEDLQALEGDAARQDRLLELADRLCRGSTHVLITGRKLPGELREFSSRWVSRCHGGLCVTLPSLSSQSRAELISQLAQSRHLPFTEPVARTTDWLAERWAVSPREIVSLMNRLVVHCQRNPAVIDVPFLERWLSQDSPAVLLSFDAITTVVASEFGIGPDELRSRSRQQGLIVPRQCAMFLAKELTGRSLDLIGHYFGDRSHTTVSHGLSRLKELLPTAPTLRQQIQRLRKRLAEVRREDCA